ncbi:hypothetical protein L202_07366 [Cryptococcus amylolentus CBS 6039]|uniref:Uncharacterized protein n=2 Tax=Cryptococcus amylolentus TaxID=104669 RepID=A0A1E3HBZ1_9TREE|nr:hypothetical protein L202_07366 [Cryptococcus amylolentus CBS 6039]ODN73843.1 hypothetical protein L202_07366 [Cryptococcus amylolentus CBS 6039]ODO00298.1 hypothetical protein I350_06929 [Cryptococcus amylolentus CBS 6273]
MAQTSLNSLTMELGMLKRQAINAEIYLECLNKLVEPLAVVQGPMGLRTWLSEIQHFMGLMKQRSFQGFPLSPRERQVVQWYSTKWRELRGGPCDMGRPEAQIVLISLNELCRV